MYEEQPLYDFCSWNNAEPLLNIQKSMNNFTYKWRFHTMDSNQRPKKKKKSLGYFDEYSVYIRTNFCLSVVRYERLQQIHMKPKSAGSLAYN